MSTIGISTKNNGTIPWVAGLDVTMPSIALYTDKSDNSKKENRTIPATASISSSNVTIPTLTGMDHTITNVTHKALLDDNLDKFNSTLSETDRIEPNIVTFPSSTELKA